MDKNDIENLLNQLKNIEQSLSGENTDVVFNDIEVLINQINSDIKTNHEFAMNVNFIKLQKDAKKPSYAKDGDAGLDFWVSRIISETETQISYGSDIAMEIPKGYVGLLFPRSSIRDTELILSNCVGVIDSGYRGEIMSTFDKLNGKWSNKYNIGDRMCQMIIIPYPKINLVEKNSLSETERGSNGYGHSGK